MRAQVCPRDCPRRCADPNCHNPETCEIWAAHLVEMEKIHEARRKHHALEDDLASARRKEKARKIWERRRD